MKVRLTYRETSRTTLQYEVDDAEFDVWLAARDVVRPDEVHPCPSLGYFVQLFLEDSLAASDALVREFDIERARQGAVRGYTGLEILEITRVEVLS